MDTQKKPWQIAPSDFIAHAIEHANKSTDFDKQMAFLVLDIGVETAIKTYIEKDKKREFKTYIKKMKNKGDENGKIEVNEDDLNKVSFFTILTALKEFVGNRIPEFDPDIVNSYHKQRNDLYHNETRLNPPDEDLRSYIEIAKKILKALLDIDIDKQQEIEKAKASESDQSYYSAERILQNIQSLQSNSTIMVEHLYPQIGSRKFEAQLRNIRTITGPNDESYSPLQQAGIRQTRIEEFNKLTKWEFEYDESDLKDYEFVEYIIDHPEDFCVWVAFQEMNEENWQEDWKKYLKIIKFHSHNESEEIFKWTHEKAISVIKWVELNMKDITLIGPAISLDYWNDFFKDDEE